MLPVERNSLMMCYECYPYCPWCNNQGNRITNDAYREVQPHSVIIKTSIKLSNQILFGKMCQRHSIHSESG